MPLDDVDVRIISVIQKYLLKYGKAHPKTETLAKEVGVDKSTLLRHRHKLVQEGYVVIEPSTGRGKSNLYYLTERVAKGSQESVAKGGDATLVVLTESLKDSVSTTESVYSRTTPEESVVVRHENENDSPSPSLRSAGFAPAQGIPGTTPCWVCGVLVVTSRGGDMLRGFRPDENLDVWQHRKCPGYDLRTCTACGLPVDPVEKWRLDEWGERVPPEAKTSIAGWCDRPRDAKTYAPWFVSHAWPDCEYKVFNMIYGMDPEELYLDECAAHEEDLKHS